MLRYKYTERGTAITVVGGCLLAAWLSTPAVVITIADFCCYSLCCHRDNDDSLEGNSCYILGIFSL